MKRYVTAFHTEEISKCQKEVLIIGSGIASLYTALMFEPTVPVTILSRSSYQETNSYLAQGGIAAPIDPQDHPRKHFQDTMVCGKNTNSEEAVWTLVSQANENIEKLMQLGVDFDHTPDGTLSLGKEGAHSMSRILHVGGDNTGAEVMKALFRKVEKQQNIEIIEEAYVIDLLTNEEGCIGALAYVHEEMRAFYSLYTIMASGGIGGIYSRTTNASGIQGDGIAMALRAGAVLKDMHAVQFHPTGFYNKENPHEKHTFLISEAVRGEGGILLNHKGQRFMEGIHSQKELAPRDIAAAAIYEQIEKQGIPYVFLDITHMSKEKLMKRFPKIYGYCQEQNIDISQEPIPVAPVAHYFMGGIAVDLEGRTSINGLYACGECACTGVHGENRLASNSLLEAIVFGRRIAQEIQKELSRKKENHRIVDISSLISAVTKIPKEADGQLEEWMMKYCGIVRKGGGLRTLFKELDDMKKKYTNGIVTTKEEIGFVNKLTVAHRMVKDALDKVKMNIQEEKIW